MSWNEIKSRAIAFQKEWEGESSEKAESQPLLPTQEKRPKRTRTCRNCRALRPKGRGFQPVAVKREYLHPRGLSLLEDDLAP